MQMVTMGFVELCDFYINFYLLFWKSHAICTINEISSKGMIQQSVILYLMNEYSNILRKLIPKFYKAER